MRRFLRDNGLSLFFGLIFLLALSGQAVAGHADFDNRQLAQGLQPISLGSYLTSAAFATDVMENWQSEFLQFFLYVFATVWLVQRGSPESKEIDKVDRESDEDQKVGPFAEDDSPRWARVGSLRTAIYSRSLGFAMATIFVLSWLAQSITGVTAYNEQQLSQLEAPISWLSYVTSADFWSRTLQNWQSEFLAVGTMAVLSIYLRQRGSSESKPVGARHDATGTQG